MSKANKILEGSLGDGLRVDEALDQDMLGCLPQGLGEGDDGGALKLENSTSKAPPIGCSNKNQGIRILVAHLEMGSPWMKLSMRTCSEV
jgi:hypothetical protein